MQTSGYSERLMQARTAHGVAAAAALEKPAGSRPDAALLGRRWRETLVALLQIPSAVLGGLVVLFWALCAVFWPLLAPYNPTIPDYTHALARPSLAHLAGTDPFGRDVLSRVLAGSRQVLILAPTATAIGLTGGILIGLLTAYYGGWLDDILSRVMEAIMAFPLIIIALTVLFMFGASPLNTILVIGIAYVPLVSRVVRAAAMSVRDLDYVSAARLRGARGPEIMLTEILPNISGPVAVEATVRIGYAIFTIASLSFIGLGTGPDSTDWGSMLYALKDYLPIDPWMVLAPALAIASLVVALNLLADGLRQATRA